MCEALLSSIDPADGTGLEHMVHRQSHIEHCGCRGQKESHHDMYDWSDFYFMSILYSMFLEISAR
jgi:hypothetical protein